MEGQRRLWQAVSATRRSLSFEKLIIALQKGLLYAVLSITVIYLATRFFVMPYYTRIGMIVAFVGLIVPLIVAFWHRPKQKEALLKLDQYYPHNELVTVLTAKEKGPLVDLLQQKAEAQVGQVLEAFKKRPKELFQSKIMSIVGGLLIVFFLLNIFPAATQQEAKSIEEDRAITKQLKEKVKEQVEKPVPEEAKKELAELQKAIEEAKTSDEALKELVKKQKELTNLQQQLAEETKGKGSEALDSLTKANTELAEAASEAQTSLSKLGKPVDLNTQKLIANMNRDPQISAGSANGNGQQSNANQNTNGQNNNSGSSSNNSNGTGQSSSNTSSGQGSSGQSGQSGSGQQGSGNQQGNQGGNGNGNGNGQGNAGSGSGSGNGGGQGGLQGGKGSGGRELLAIPQRIGEANGQTVDGGVLGKGETVKEKGQVPATKGEVRPYAEVIGSYEESYRQSADRLQLPSDLQQMVQNYYSSIE